MLLSLPTKHIVEKYEMNKNFKNFNIYYWNFLPLINLKYFNRKKISNKLKNFIYIHDYKTLYKLYKKLPKNFFYANFVGNYFITSFLELLFTLKKGKKIFIDFGTFIELKFREKIFKKLKNLISHFGLIFVLKKILFFVLGSFKILINMKLLQKTPSYFFVSSEFSKKKIKKNFSTDKIFEIDGDDMRKFNKRKIKKEKKIITFLDQGFDDNFDYSLRNYKNTKFSNETYWKKMNNFFELVEKTFPDHRLVIASHPRRSEKSIKRFIKKKCFSNKTLELVAQSKLVIAHYSQSINFVVLLKKPLLLLDSDDFNSHTLTRSLAVRKFRSLLGSKIINLENYIANKKILNDKNYLNINESKYNNFKNFYIGFNGEKSNKGTWKSIVKSL